jgi:hypothetical protein
VSTTIAPTTIVPQTVVPTMAVSTTIAPTTFCAAKTGVCDQVHPSQRCTFSPFFLCSRQRGRLCALQRCTFPHTPSPLCSGQGWFMHPPKKHLSPHPPLYGARMISALQRMHLFPHPLFCSGQGWLCTLQRMRLFPSHPSLPPLPHP